MKKMKKFFRRKIKEFGESLLFWLITISLCALVLALLALPGVIVAFLVSGANPDTLIVGGSLSFLLIVFIVAVINKINKIIKEYKAFNDEEC